MIKKIVLTALILFLISCEDRIYLERTPDIILKDGVYVLDPAGYSYTKAVLNAGGMCHEITACGETSLPPAVLFNPEGGYCEMHLINGADTVYSRQTYVGRISAGNCLKITALDVKQGDCFIIEPPGRKPTVIDGGYGSLGYYDWQGGGEKTLSLRLKEKGLTELKYIIETHHDLDHYGGLLDITTDASFSFEAYLDNASSALPSVGDTLFFGAGVKGIVLHFGEVEGEPGTDENNRSVCLKFIFNDFEMIFTGDIGETAEQAIISGGLIDPSEMYEFLKVAHHGSGYSSSAGFIDAVLPVYSVISSGSGNPYGHPAQETLDRLAGSDTTILRTDIVGTVEIYTDGASFQTVYKK